MNIQEDGYNQLFRKMRSDGFFGVVSFRIVNGEVQLIKFESTYKSVTDALEGKTTAGN